MTSPFHRLGVAIAIAWIAGSQPALGQDIPPSNAVAAERVRIEFTAPAAFVLVDRTPVRSVLPPSDALPESLNGLSGFWYELREANGALRYRRVQGNPVLLEFEGPASGGGEPPGEAEGMRPERTAGIPERRAFSLLIPAPLPGDVLVLLSSPLEAGREFDTADEVARFDLLPIIP